MSTEETAARSVCNEELVDGGARTWLCNREPHPGDEFHQHKTVDGGVTWREMPAPEPGSLCYYDGPAEGYQAWYEENYGTTNSPRIWTMPEIPADVTAVVTPGGVQWNRIGEARVWHEAGDLYHEMNESLLLAAEKSLTEVKA